MQALFSTALISSVLLVIPATVLMFTIPPPDGGGGGRPADRLRLVGAAVLVGVATLGIGALVGASAATSVLAAILLTVSVLGWSAMLASWEVRGVLVWALGLDVGLLYLTYVTLWTASAGLGPGALAAAVLLLGLELFVLVIGIGYLWELVDVLARHTWTGAVDPDVVPGPADRAGTPAIGSRDRFVSLHVPTHNEPPEMVIATLQHLLDLDYADYEILLIDNNTADEALWRPVEAFCAGHERITFFHLEGWPGFKSGALNFALARTDPRAEVIGIVDADYQVRPDFLARCVPLFADASVAFVQTPQDYRGWEGAPYFRRLYYSYGYFFDVSQRSRNERNGAIFGGTMGLIRRSALVASGGWDEWCITEDAELSLRLLAAGHRGIHVDRSYGHGVMPLTFEALKRQRFRWCFGGVQILRMHWRDLLPGPRRPGNRLTLSQRWAYAVGGLQWFGDLASVMFTGFLAVAALGVLVGNTAVIRQLSTVLLVCVVAVVLLGAARSVALVRRTGGATWGEAWGALGLWLGLGWTVAQACVRGLFARQGAFLRTPKTHDRLDWIDAVRGNAVELVWGLGLSMLALATLTRGTGPALVVGVLLLVQALGFLAAPANSWAAIRSAVPEPLHRQRRYVAAPWKLPVRQSGVYVVALAAAALAALVWIVPQAHPDLGRIPREVTDQAQGEVETGPLGPTPSRTPTQRRTVRPAASADPTGGHSATAAPSSGPTSGPTAGPRSTPTGRPPAPRDSSTPSPTGRPRRTPTAQPTGRTPGPPPGGPGSRRTDKPDRPGRPDRDGRTDGAQGRGEPVRPWAGLGLAAPTRIARSHDSTEGSPCPRSPATRWPTWPTSPGSTCPTPNWTIWPRSWP